jgi:rod shape-determining protein MreD
MKWIGFLILAYAVVLVETSLSWVLNVNASWLGPVGPDLAAMVVVFVALYARAAGDAMLAGWVMGLAVDLTCGSGVGSETAVGPMAVAYCLLAGQLWRIRDAFFRERALTQVVLSLMFTAAAHFVWVTAQALLALRQVTFGDYAAAMGQALLIACYTALLMPLAHYGLIRIQRLILANPAGPSRRGRR